MTVHPIPPLFTADSKILILGSFPSVKSRETMFFYGHPRNRFWCVLAAVFSDELPETVGEKRAFLLRHRIALWDVIASCDIVNSSDAKIKNAAVNDISSILASAKIERVYVNGKTAAKLYEKHIEPKTGIKAVPLPSTSPANAAVSLEALILAWERIARAQ